MEISGAAMQCNATLGLQCNAMQHLVSCNAMQLWGCNAMQCNALQCNSGDAMQCNIWYHSKEGRDSSAGKTQIWYRPRGDMETPSVASQCNAMWCNIWRVNGPTWYINSILHDLIAIPVILAFILISNSIFYQLHLPSFVSLFTCRSISIFPLTRLIIFSERGTRGKRSTWRLEWRLK